MSQVSAGGNLTLLASDGSITSQGTQLSAEGNALLLASQNIDLGVAHTTESSGNDSRGKGWSFNNAAGLPFGNYNQKGNGNGQTDTITGTQLSVGGNVSLSAGGTYTQSASKKGVSGVPTAEFNVQGLGMVDVYAPTNLSPVTIAREIEKKVFQGQANSVIVVVPEGFSKVDMYKAAAAAFGKSKGGKSIPLNQVIFSQGGKTIQLDRRAINSLLGGKGG